MKILLTGATGFLGKKLLANFIQKNHQIIITTRQKNKNLFSQEILQKITIWYLDQDIGALFAEHPDIDFVVHAATNYGYEQTLPTEVFWANVKFPIELLEYAINFRVRAFINMDSFFNNNKIDYHYMEAYSLSKQHFQQWGKLCAMQSKINFINLKLFHLFGPNDNPKKFIPTLIQRCLNGESIDLTNGEHRRDFIYTDDVVRAVDTIIAANLTGYQHYDVGRGESIKLKDFIKMVGEICNHTGTLNFGVLPTREGEPADIFADAAPLKSLGWAPKISVFEGLKAIIP